MKTVCACLFSVNFLIFCGSVSGQPTSNSALFNEIQKKLLAQPAVSGHFKQTRKIKEVDAVLQSGGAFELNRKKQTIRWEQKTPFYSLLSIRGDRYEFHIEGQAPKVLEAQADPAIFSFAVIFASLLKGDVGFLREQFAVKESGTVEAWHLSLVPKGALVKKAIQEIEIDGGKFIRRVRIGELSGNEMSIHFNDVRVSEK